MKPDTVVIDFETYFSTEYSLSKLPTQRYISDNRFQVIGLAWVNATTGEEGWVTGETDEDVEKGIRALELKKHIVVAHNAMFDAGILAFRYGIHPRFVADTRFMARQELAAWLPRVDLGSVAKHLGLGEKGDTLSSTKGMRRDDIISNGLMDSLGQYALNDARLCLGAYQLLKNRIQKQELILQYITLCMFLKPKLKLDSGLLKLHIQAEQSRKAALLKKIGSFEISDLMSNARLAAMLTLLGVTPPKKVSPRTGKTTYAFAKTDEGFKALRNHDNYMVRNVVEARLGVKSSIEEKRAERLLDIALHCARLAVPLLWFGAHTGRLSGTDKLNLQNLPARRGNVRLRQALRAPEGHTVIAADLSQIECRLTALFCGEEWLLDIFRRKEDPYSLLASKVFQREITKEKYPIERFVGKVGELSLGYGVGAHKFLAMLQNEIENPEGMDLLKIALTTLEAYRATHPRTVTTWRVLSNYIPYLRLGSEVEFPNGLIRIGRSKVMLPNGVSLNYPGLRMDSGNWVYQFGNETRKLYGAKLLENVIQALAGAVIQKHMLDIGTRYGIALQVHDEIVVVVPNEQVEEAVRFIQSVMSTPPEWAPTLPVDVEIATGPSYGDCKST